MNRPKGYKTCRHICKWRNRMPLCQCPDTNLFVWSLQENIPRVLSLPFPCNLPCSGGWLCKVRSLGHMPSTCLIIGAGASKIISLHGKDKRNIFLGAKDKRIPSVQVDLWWYMRCEIQVKKRLHDPNQDLFWHGISFKQSNMAFVLPFIFSSSLLCSLFLFLCIFDSFFLATAIQLTEFNFVLQITTHQSVTKFCLQRRRQQRHIWQKKMVLLLNDCMHMPWHKGDKRGYFWMQNLNLNVQLDFAGFCTLLSAGGKTSSPNQHKCNGFYLDLALLVFNCHSIIHLAICNKEKSQMKYSDWTPPNTCIFFPLAWPGACSYLHNNPANLTVSHIPCMFSNPYAQYIQCSTSHSFHKITRMIIQKHQPHNHTSRFRWQKQEYCNKLGVGRSTHHILWKQEHHCKLVDKQTKRPVGMHGQRWVR